MNACLACDRGNVPLFSVGCVQKQIRACRDCIRKHGRETLKLAANAAVEYMLTHRPKPPEPICRHCSGPVVVNPDGSVPLWCQECHRGLQRLAAS